VIITNGGGGTLADHRRPCYTGAATGWLAMLLLGGADGHALPSPSRRWRLDAAPQSR
jgi:hypothetical protein